MRKNSGLLDGYGSIPDMDGPFRDNQGTVVYYDPVTGRYIPASEVHRYMDFG